MINLDSKQELRIFSNAKIAPVLDKNTPINYKIREWDLTQLSTMLTVDSLADDEARKKAAYRSKRNSNALFGGIVGGLIDAGSGDDSIIDGVLLGAAFGAIATSSPEKPKAQLGLVFLDGSHISVEVDKEEYTQLQTIAAVSTADSNRESKPSFEDRNLSVEEIAYVLSERSGGAFKHTTIMLMFTLFMVNFAPRFLTFLDPEALENTENSLMRLGTLISNNYFIYGISSIIVLLIVVNAVKQFFSKPDLESFLLSDDEREFYSSQVGKKVEA